MYLPLLLSIYMGCCEDYLTCDIAFNAVMPLSRASTRGSYSRIEGVTSEALTCLATEALQRSAYGHLVMEIKYLSGIREFIPQKLSRVQNRVAGRLAKYSRTD